MPYKRKTSGIISAIGAIFVIMSAIFFVTKGYHWYSDDRLAICFGDPISCYGLYQFLDAKYDPNCDLNLPFQQRLHCGDNGGPNALVDRPRIWQSFFRWWNYFFADDDSPRWHRRAAAVILGILWAILATFVATFVFKWVHGRWRPH